MIVFAVSALALGFSRYQTNRLERSLVQENFRYTVSIISEEVQYATTNEILEPKGTEMSFELYLRDRENETNIIRFYINRNVGSIESQVFRDVYYNVNMPDWVSWREKIRINASDKDKPEESEPVSDKIRSISHLLFTYREGVVIFITGETANKSKVSYVSLVFPRN